MERWKKHPWVPPAPKGVIERLYTQEGMTFKEVADHIGCTVKRVQTAMRRFGIKARPAIPRNQAAERNGNWKGAKAGYQAKHLRVQRLRGRPRMCQVCGTTDPVLWYDWANLTGDYDNPTDYKRMCRSCHRHYDSARRDV